MRSKGILPLLLTLLAATVLLPGPARGDTVTVGSYAQLLQAVNETAADTVLLSPDYAHGSDSVGQSLHPEGTVTIRPAGEGEQDITGRFDISGGTVVFERVRLTGSADSPALCVTGEANVTADSVTGGSSSKGIGRAAVEAVGACAVQVTEALGGDGLTMGGDGILALNGARVTADAVTGGASGMGYGGCGALACDAAVTVNGMARGGSGGLSAGQPLLTLGFGTATASAREDIDIHSYVPAQAGSYADLLWCIRLGQTDISLASGYRHGQAAVLDAPWPIPAGVTVAVHAAGKKNAALQGRVYLVSGTAQLTGITVEATDDICLMATGTAAVSLTGRLKAGGSGMALLAADSASVSVTGSVTGLCYARGSSLVTVDGDISRISARVPGCVLLTQDASLTVSGSLSGFTRVTGCGQLTVSGSLTGVAGYNALYACDDSVVTVKGSVTGKATSAPAVAA